jgi:CheY-like chemotaxis protein
MPPSKRRPPRPPPDLRGRVALVADSSPHTAELFARGLRCAGVGVLVADSCTTAIEHLRICRFDLVVLDLELPVGRAHRVLRHMRADPRHAETRAIVVAAACDRSDRSDRWLATLEGADALLTKPVCCPTLWGAAAALLPYRPKLGLVIGG